MQLRQANPRRQGDIGEGIAAAWLIQAGFGVWIPFGHSPDCDLIAQRGEQLWRVQVKTATTYRSGRDQVVVATRGGKQSWNRISKRFSAHRCDWLFVLVGDGRRWLIPAVAVEGTTGICLGGPKYAEFELHHNRDGELPVWLQAELTSRANILEPPRGSAEAGESGEAVNLVPMAEGVRIPPPPSRAPATAPAKPYSRTSLSGKHQVTIPTTPLKAAGLEAGDTFRVDALGPGQVALTRLERPGGNDSVSPSSPRATSAPRAGASAS
jgi:hypothetical protein